MEKAVKGRGQDVENTGKLSWMETLAMQTPQEGFLCSDPSALRGPAQLIPLPIRLMEIQAYCPSLKTSVFRHWQGGRLPGKKALVSG